MMSLLYCFLVTYVQLKENIVLLNSVHEIELLSQRQYVENSACNFFFVIIY